MKIPVLVHARNGSRFRAEVVLSSFTLVAEGSAREDALKNLRQLIREKMKDGIELTYLEIDEPDNPWLKLAGIFKDDPYWTEYCQAIEDNRRQVESDPDR